jgi:DNA-directed RNA polymerase specialized sigma24 family protein
MSMPLLTVDEMEQYALVWRDTSAIWFWHVAEAEDLAQETFLRDHRQRNSLRDPAVLPSWLYQIATHLSIDRLRQRAKTVQRQVDVPVEDLPIANQNRPSPLTIVQQTEMSECVQRYVADLSDAHKFCCFITRTGSLLKRFPACFSFP